jgi:hypothetical protein
MNPILGLLSAPSALGLAQQTAKAAAPPFDLLLQAARDAAGSESTGADLQEKQDEATAFDNLALQLQDLLSSLGVGAGEKMRLTADGETGKIRVDGHELAGSVEAAIANDPGLAANLQDVLASAVGADAGLNDAELQVEAAEDQQPAILEWR